MDDHAVAVPAKLCAFACMLLCVSLTGDALGLWAPSLLGFLYLAAQRRWKLCLSFGAFYLVLAVLLWAILVQGLRMAVFSEFNVLLFWTLAPAMIVSWDLVVTPPGMLAEFLSRVKAPTAVILGVLVVFRFFPTMRAELANIGRAMRNRGLARASQVARHPAAACEHVLVPLLLQCLQMADRLSASAIARGAEAPVARSSYHARPLRWSDWAWMAVWIGAAAAFLTLGGTRF